jgi:hypothetical protein
MAMMSADAAAHDTFTATLLPIPPYLSLGAHILFTLNLSRWAVNGTWLFVG